MPLDQKEIGKTIAHLRKKAGFTQKGLADRLFISDKAVSKWERGLSVPDVAYLGRLSVLLDIDIDTLLEGKRGARATEWKGLLFTDREIAGVSFKTSIYDKPLVYYLLSYFLLVGVRDILVVCTDDERMFLEKLLGDGGRLGIKLTFCAENEVNGVGDVVRKNRSFFDGKNIMTIFENVIIYGAGLTYLLQRAMLNHDCHTVIAMPVVNAEHKRICFDEAKCVVSDNNLKTNYEYKYLPVIFSPYDLLVEDVEDDTAPNEFVKKLVESNSLYIETANRGMAGISLENADEVLDASSFIKVLQKQSGTYVGCLEEIAWRRGLINRDDLHIAAQEYGRCEYSDYLMKLI